MSFIHSITSGVPEYTLNQQEFYTHVASSMRPRLRSIFKRILDGSQIKKRHFSAPIQEMISMTEEKRVEDKFLLWKDTTTEFFTKQCQELLDKSGLLPTEIDGIITSTTSGFVTPHIDVILKDKLGLRSNITRLPLFGYGCSGGMAAINRAKEILDGAPHKAFLVCVGETLSNQYETATEVSVLVSNSIFSDGFASVLMVGKDHPLAKTSQVELLNSQSFLFPETNYAIGQWMTDEGLHTHVDYKLPRLIKENAYNPISNLFVDIDLDIEDIDYWVVHAGGPKVMEALADALNLNPKALEFSLDVYRNFGNQSSVSVLTALDYALKTYKKAGLGYMMAIGPGVHMEFCTCNIMPRKAEKEIKKEEKLLATVISR